MLIESNLEIMLLNSNFFTIASASLLNISSKTQSDIFTSTGTLVFIVASVLLIWAISKCSFKASLFLLFFISSACSNAFSIEPYSLIIVVAPFSPIPGTPGILSEESPISAFTSINSLGVTLYFSNTCVTL